MIHVHVDIPNFRTSNDRGPGINNIRKMQKAVDYDMLQDQDNAADCRLKTPAHVTLTKKPVVVRELREATGM